MMISSIDLFFRRDWAVGTGPTFEPPKLVPLLVVVDPTTGAAVLAASVDCEVVVPGRGFDKLNGGGTVAAEPTLGVVVLAAIEADFVVDSEVVVSFLRPRSANRLDAGAGDAEDIAPLNKLGFCAAAPDAPSDVDVCVPEASKEGIWNDGLTAALSPVFEDAPPAEVKGGFD